MRNVGRDLRTALGALVAWGVALAVVAAVLATPVLESPFPLLVVVAGLAASVALVLGQRLETNRAFLGAWIALAAALGVYSALTGVWNNMTEEPFTTPAFVHLFPNLYGGTLRLSYSAYGAPLATVVTPYVYLPLLPWIQVPGVNYRFVSLAAWGAMLALVRRDGRAVVLLGHPWLAVFAANGFNDFVPLLLLTLVFAAPASLRSRAWEVPALAVKQFANVVIVGYYLVVARWKDAAIAAAVTALVILPFFVLDPSGTICHALLIDWDPSCSGPPSGGPFASPHLNYVVWPVWILAIWGTPIWAWVRRRRKGAAASGNRSGSPSRPGSGDGPSADLADRADPPFPKADRARGMVAKS